MNTFLTLFSAVLGDVRAKYEAFSNLPTSPAYLGIIFGYLLLSVGLSTFWKPLEGHSRIFFLTLGIFTIEFVRFVLFHANGMASYIGLVITWIFLFFLARFHRLCEYLYCMGIWARIVPGMLYLMGIDPMKLLFNHVFVGNSSFEYLLNRLTCIACMLGLYGGAFWFVRQSPKFPSLYRQIFAFSVALYPFVECSYFCKQSGSFIGYWLALGNALIGAFFAFGPWESLLFPCCEKQKTQ